MEQGRQAQLISLANDGRRIQSARGYLTSMENWNPWLVVVLWFLFLLEGEIKQKFIALYGVEGGAREEKRAG